GLDNRVAPVPAAEADNPRCGAGAVLQYRAGAHHGDFGGDRCARRATCRPSLLGLRSAGTPGAVRLRDADPPGRPVCRLPGPARAHLTYRHDAHVPYAIADAVSAS